jgi:hypothetical protein
VAKPVRYPRRSANGRAVPTPLRGFPGPNLPVWAFAAANAIDRRAILADRPADHNGCWATGEVAAESLQPACRVPI